MEQIRKSSLLTFCLVIFLTNIYSQNKSNQKYIVNEIDSVSLYYYYIIKVTKNDTSSKKLNLLSKKIIFNTVSKNKHIEIGELYFFELEPMYEIIDKRHGKDSVALSPAMMRSVDINGETFISANYTIQPYSTINLVGLYYIKEKRCFINQKK